MEITKKEKIDFVKLSISIEKKQLKLLKTVSKINNVSVSELIRMLIDNDLKP